MGCPINDDIIKAEGGLANDYTWIHHDLLFNMCYIVGHGYTEGEEGYNQSKINVKDN